MQSWSNSFPYLNHRKEKNMPCHSLVGRAFLLLLKNASYNKNFYKTLNINPHRNEWYLILMTCIQAVLYYTHRGHSIHQGILKGEVSLYHWPPVWLVWNQLYDNWQFFVFICKTYLSKPVKQEVNSTVILPPLVFPGIHVWFSQLSPGWPC